MGFEDAAAALAASAAAARARKDVRAAVESLAAEASEAHAAGERDRIERDLVRLAGELDAADARSIARDAALHGEVEDEARARCTRPTPWPRPHSSKNLSRSSASWLMSFRYWRALATFCGVSCCV